jgi:hypothetical protein
VPRMQLEVDIVAVVVVVVGKILSTAQIKV